MSLHVAVAEAQRIIGQLEDVVGEARDYPAQDREKLGVVLSDLAVRVELVRCAVLDPEPEPGES